MSESNALAAAAGRCPTLPPSLTGDLPAAEAGSVARAMAAAYHRMVTYYCRELKRTPDEAHIQATDAGDEQYQQQLLGKPPDQYSWWELNLLAEKSPDVAHGVWERLKAEAVDELESGHRAIQALEFDTGPWDRAQFLAIRRGFLDEWRPRGGIEHALIDTLAQTWAGYLWWLRQLSMVTTTEGKLEEALLRRDGHWKPPRIGVAETIDQSAAMVDRFHRLFLRTLRALRDYRRHAPQVVVQNAAQVNVASVQQNVASDARGVRERVEARLTELEATRAKPESPDGPR